MATFQSNDQFFSALRDTIGRLRASGFTQAATQLQEGFDCLNGLTDGWVALLESVRKVQSEYAATLAAEDHEALEKIREAAHAAITRQ